VNVGRQGLKATKVLWDLRESRENPDVLVQRVTEGNRGHRVLRGFPVFPVREAPEETLVRWVLPDAPALEAVRGREVTQALRESKVFRASAAISVRRVTRAAKAPREIWGHRVLPDLQVPLAR